MQTIIVKETRGTLSERWPFLWRLGQYYYLFEVQDPRYAKGYYIFSHTEEDGTLRYHCLAHTPYIMVRVGPESKRIWVETREKEMLPLVYTGIRRALPLVRQKDHVSKIFLKQYTRAEEIVWT